MYAYLGVAGMQEYSHAYEKHEKNILYASAYACMHAKRKDKNEVHIYVKDTNVTR